jgi:hypothetical protein
LALAAEVDRVCNTGYLRQLIHRAQPVLARRSRAALAAHFHQRWVLIVVSRVLAVQALFHHLALQEQRAAADSLGQVRRTPTPVPPRATAPNH